MSSVLQVRDSTTGEWINMPALVGPKGEPGQSGVYFGKEEPIDENVNVWIRDTDNSDNILNFVSYTPQSPTPEQQAQARENIGAVGVSDLPSAETGGLTTAQINALDALFRAAAYTTDVSDKYAAFRKAFGLESGDEPDVPDEPDIPDTPTYTITNNLTGVINSNNATTIVEGNAYNATLTVEDGYVLNNPVIITMGGVDITANVYGEGYILITEVIGDIVITAVAEKPVLIDMITQNTNALNFYAGEDSTTPKVATHFYATAYLSKRATLSNAEVSITFTNNTDTAVSLTACAGSHFIDVTNTTTSGLVGITGAMSAFHAEQLVSNLSLAVGDSFTRKYTLKAGYHLMVYQSANVDIVVSGILDLDDLTTDYELVAATGTAWSFYSGNTVNDDEKVGSIYNFNTYYKIAEPFAEDTTLHITLYNSTDADQPFIGKIAARYDGVTAKVAFDTVVWPLGHGGGTIKPGVEVLSFEYTVPAGNTLITLVPTGCAVIKKIS